jgi:nitrate reductase assembly molybdenum cofactor insertion protein NarJ
MTECTMHVDVHVRSLLREAARWRLLGRLFECPSDEWRHDVMPLAKEADDAGLQAAAEQAGLTATEGQYHSVFGPGGPAPPREASYHDSVELGSLMSELAGYYDAFGYRPATSEAPDHLAVELGFVAYLRFNEAYARAVGDADRAAITAQASDRFRADHLSKFTAPLADVLSDSGIEYLAQASRVLVEYVGHRPQRTRLPVVVDPVDDTGTEFPCCER